MVGESFGQRWLEKAHAERIKVDTKMESKDEDGNGLGPGSQCRETACILRKRREKLRSDSKMLEQVSKAEAREAGTETQVPQDARVTREGASLRPWARRAVTTLHSWGPHTGLLVRPCLWLIQGVVIFRF